MKEDTNKVNFRNELQGLINSHSLENGSNTTDYIIADYLMECLGAFELAMARKAAHERSTPEVE